MQEPEFIEKVECCNEDEILNEEFPKKVSEHNSPENIHLLNYMESIDFCKMTKFLYDLGNIENE